MFAVIIVILLLAACGDEGTASDIPADDSSSPQESSQTDMLPLSDALEEYSVWFRVYDEVTRDSQINEVFVFENGEFKSYYTDGKGLFIEDIVDMSHDEFLEHVRETLRAYSEERDYEEDFEEPQSSEYTLDIILDDLGQDTEMIDINTTEGTISLSGYSVVQTVYDTTFAGFRYPDDSNGEIFLTSVDDSFTGFELDGPDTNKENVTIEGK
jgi:hypothetical protein